jgi:hypothetical protein
MRPAGAARGRLCARMWACARASRPLPAWPFLPSLGLACAGAPARRRVTRSCVSGLLGESAQHCRCRAAGVAAAARQQRRARAPRAARRRRRRPDGRACRRGRRGRRRRARAARGGAGGRQRYCGAGGAQAQARRRPRGARRAGLAAGLPTCVGPGARGRAGRGQPAERRRRRRVRSANHVRHQGPPRGAAALPARARCAPPPRAALPGSACGPDVGQGAEPVSGCVWALIALLSESGQPGTALLEASRACSPRCSALSRAACCPALACHAGRTARGRAGGRRAGGYEAGTEPPAALPLPEGRVFDPPITPASLAAGVAAAAGTGREGASGPCMACLPQSGAGATLLCLRRPLTSLAGPHTVCCRAVRAQTSHRCALCRPAVEEAGRLQGRYPIYPNPTLTCACRRAGAARAAGWPRGGRARPGRLAGGAAADAARGHAHGRAGRAARALPLAHRRPAALWRAPRPPAPRLLPCPAARLSWPLQRRRVCLGAHERAARAPVQPLLRLQPV